MTSVLSFNALPPLDRLSASRFETPVILRRLAAASRELAELKGVAGTIPHQGILINTLGMREAKDSSAIENIVTTHDELFREDVFPEMVEGTAAKEVHCAALLGTSRRRSVHRKREVRSGKEATGRRGVRR